MIEQLSSLLLPIDALLAHNLFDPRVHTDLPPEVVPLFRNMWFLCVLFHFTLADDKAGSAVEWRRPALLRIAVKTPSIVLEESRDSLFGDIEYNAVIRQEYAQAVSQFCLSHQHRFHIPLGHHQAPQSSQLVHLTSGQRNPLLVSGSSCLSTRHARCRKYARCGGSPITACVIFRE